jgi:hypothetical protein
MNSDPIPNISDKEGILAPIPRPTQRPPLSNTIRDVTTQARNVPAKTEKIMDRIHSSYSPFPSIMLEFGRTHWTDYFNPYRVSPNRSEILDKEAIQRISEQAYAIADKIPFDLHDGEVDDIKVNGLIVTDLLRSSGQRGTVLAVAQHLCNSITQIRDTKNILRFFYLSALRVYQRMVSEVEVGTNYLLVQNTLIVASSREFDENSVIMRTKLWKSIYACMDFAAG